MPKLRKPGHLPPPPSLLQRRPAACPARLRVGVAAWLLGARFPLVPACRPALALAGKPRQECSARRQPRAGRHQYQQGRCAVSGEASLARLRALAQAGRTRSRALVRRPRPAQGPLGQAGPGPRHGELIRLLHPSPSASRPHSRTAGEAPPHGRAARRRAGRASALALRTRICGRGAAGSMPAQPPPPPSLRDAAKEARSDPRRRGGPSPRGLAERLDTGRIPAVPSRGSNSGKQKAPVVLVKRRLPARCKTPSPGPRRCRPAPFPGDAASPVGAAQPPGPRGGG